MKNLKIIFLGTPSFVQLIKDTLAQYFTMVDSLKGADLAVVAAYGKILTKEEINTPKNGCINVHPSLLPKYRGPSPIQSEILNGDSVSGISIIKIDEEVDHGPIIYQEEMELSNSDNFDTLSKKMFLRASEVLPKIIEDFVHKKMVPSEQNHKEATFCERLTRDSGYFEIDNPPIPEKLDRMIRAYYPWPGVWTRWNNKIVKFLPLSHPVLDTGSINNNRLLDSRLPALNASRIDAGGRGNDKFLIQMEGKKVMPLKDFLNGYPDFPLKNLSKKTS